MKKEIELNGLFFELIQVAIGERVCLSHSPSADEWGELYAMAKKQSLVGVCFAAVQRLYNDNANDDDNHSNSSNASNLSELQYLTWMGMAAKIQQKNEIVNHECELLQQKLLVDGLQSCILKGQGVAKTYGEQLKKFRQSGDIDVWIDASDYEVIDYVMQLIPTKEFDQKHIHFHCFENTEVEMHWSPAIWDNPRHNKILAEYFENERVLQFNNYVDTVCYPTASFQLAHQLLHAFRHYVYEGVGMRQLMDLYFAQLACAKGASASEEFEKVRGLFKKLGLMRFVAATQWVLKEVFLMPQDQMLCEPDAKEGQRLLDEIMIGGNFGHHDARNHKAGETFIQRFFRRWGRKFRMFRYDPLGTIIMPFTRLKLEIWMRSTRRKYNV